MKFWSKDETKIMIIAKENMVRGTELTIDYRNKTHAEICNVDKKLLPIKEFDEALIYQGLYYYD